jgi:hypothetical protein
MAYYGCSTEELYHELQRHGYAVNESRDHLSEALDWDDRSRGTEATTVATIGICLSVPRDLDLLRTSEFGPTAPVGLLVNESRSWPSVAPQDWVCVLTKFRNRLLDDEHVLPDLTALF